MLHQFSKVEDIIPETTEEKQNIEKEYNASNPSQLSKFQRNNQFDGFPSPQLMNSAPRPLQYGNGNYGQNGDGYSRAYQDYGQGRAGPNQYFPNNGPNYPDRNYAGGHHYENFQGQPYAQSYNEPSNPGTYLGQENYNPMRMPQGNEQIIGYNKVGIIAEKMPGLKKIIPAYHNTQQNTRSYLYQPQQNNYLIRQNNPQLNNKANYQATSKTPANVKSSTPDQLTLFEQKMAAVEKQLKQRKLDEFLAMTGSGNVTYFKIDKKHPIAHLKGTIFGESVSADQVLKDINKNMSQHGNKPKALNSVYAQQKQKQQSVYTALRQKQDQSKNGIPPQNFNSPSLGGQNSNYNYQNAAMQNQYLYQQSEYSQNQNPYQQNQINSETQSQGQSQGLNSQNLYLRPQGVQNENSKTYALALRDPSQFQQPPNSFNQYNQISNSFVPRAPFENQKNSQYKLQNSDFPNVESQNQNPVSPNVETQNQNPVPPNVETQNQNPVPPNTETQNQNPVPPNTETQNQNLVPLNIESQNQNPVPPNVKTQNQNSVPPNVETQNQNPVPSNVETQNQNPVPPNIETQNQNPVPPNVETQNQNPVPSNIEKQNQNTLLSNKETQNQNPKPQNVETQNQNPNMVPSNMEKHITYLEAQNLTKTEEQYPNAAQNDKQNPSPNPKNPVQAKIQNTNSQNGQSSPVQPRPTDEIDYDAIPGWYDQGMVNINATTDHTEILGSSVIIMPNTYFPVSQTVEAERKIPWDFKKAKQAMIANEMGDFTAFFFELFNIIKEKPPEDTTPLVLALKSVMDALVKSGQLAEMGEPSLTALQKGFSMLSSFPPERIQSQAAAAALMLRNRHIVYPEDLTPILDSIDSGYTDEQGDLLLKTLEDIDAFTATGNKDPLEVVKNMVEGIFRPYWTAPAANKEKLFKTINSVLVKRFKIDTQDKPEKTRRFDKENKTRDNEVHLNKKRDEYQKNLTDKQISDMRKHINDVIKKVERENEILLDKYSSKARNIQRRKMEDVKLKRKYIRNNKSRKRHPNTERFRHISKHGNNKNKISKNNQNYSLLNPSKINENAIKYTDTKLNNYQEVNTHKKITTPAFIPYTNNNKPTNQKIKMNSIEKNKRNKLIDEAVHNKINRGYLRSKHNKNQIKRTKHILKTDLNKYDRLTQNGYNYENSIRNKHENHGDFISKKGNVKFDDTHKSLKESNDYDMTDPKFKLNSDIENDDDSYDRDIRNTNIESKEINNRKSQIDIKRTKKDKTEHSIPTDDGRRNAKNTKYKSNKNVNGNLKEKNIMEESSYDDEEDLFKVMLSDAIRHSDFVFNNYRRTDDKVKVERKINDVSSYSDEESMFKRNIYKTFGYDADIVIN